VSAGDSGHRHHVAPLDVPTHKRGNGEGGITRHKKSGLYMSRYTVQTPTGPKRKTVYGKTRAEAAEKLTRAMAERDKGLVFEGDNEPLEAYLERWLNDIVRGTVKTSKYRWGAVTL
jgi:integrase